MRFLSREQLIQKISLYGKQVVENRQISTRLKKLLPDRLKEIKNQHAETEKASKATRLALCDKKYQAFILEYLKLREEAHLSRVQWETHRMYFYAKKTQRRNFRSFN